MNIVKAGFEILTPLNGFPILRHIETCGRVCYKSEEKITDTSCTVFVASLIKRGHESVLEHFSFSVRFICDRGVSHEIVRHRIASYSQESTRYCNYGNADGGCTFIYPFWMTEETDNDWKWACGSAERAYLDMLQNGASPQEARSVLPNSLKTEVVMSANLREWRHFFKLRTARAAHPQMREVAIPLLLELRSLIPVVFDDIEVPI